VKCDEAKPYCERCTSTGRQCDGYPAQSTKKTVLGLEASFEKLVVCKSIDWENGEAAERRAIDFFRCRTAPSVSGYFETDFVSDRGPPEADFVYRNQLTYISCHSGHL
jgi:hypothetical protein